MCVQFDGAAGEKGARTSGKKGHQREENRGSGKRGSSVRSRGTARCRGAVIVESDEFLAACTRIYQGREERSSGRPEESR